MYLFGASGHGKVIKEILEAQGIAVEAFIDDNPAISRLGGLPVLHDHKGLSPVIVSVGDNPTRKQIVGRLSCAFGTAIHPSAIVSPSATIGEGTVIMPGAVVNADAVIGRHCIINTGASIDHDCVLGDYCHVAPHASLCGQVRLGEGVFVGVGGALVPCVHVGDWSVVGAGAVVIRDIPAGSTVVGVPARIVTKNSEQ